MANSPFITKEIKSNSHCNANQMGPVLACRNISDPVKIYEPRRGAETFFLIAAILFFGKVWIWPVDVESQVEIVKPFGYALRIIFILVIPYSFLFFGSLIRPALQYPTSFFMAFLILCWISILWTTQPLTSLQNALDLLCLVLTALVVSQRMSIMQIQRVIFYTSFLVIAISVASSALQLDFALMSGGHDGRWRGLFGHKNNYAEFVLLSSIVAMFISKSVGVRTSIKTLFFGLALTSLIFSESSTGTALFFMAICFRLLWPTMAYLSKNRFIYIFLLVAIVYTGGVILLMSISEILGSLGRDLTFTGRTVIWSHYFDVSLRTPYFGFGYGAFFSDQGVIDEARSRLFGRIRTPHNGYIAVALGVGWIGMLLYTMWHTSLIWLGASNQLGTLSGSVFCLSACYAVFGMFEVSSAGMISFGLLLLLVTSCAALRETK